MIAWGQISVDLRDNALAKLKLSQDSSGTRENELSPACLLCGSENSFIKYDFGIPKIMRCRDCTFMWLHPKLTIEDLSAVYDKSYFANKNFLDSDNDQLYGYLDYLSERFVKQANYLKLIDLLIGYLADFQPGKSRLLDVGCGMGYLMDVAHDKGFLVDGVEFNPDAVEKLKNKYNFPVSVGDFLDYQGSGFDVLTMMDLIEHFLDPVAAVEHANRMMYKGGIMVLVTMDSDSWISRLFGKRLEDFRRVREHAFFFNRATIRTIMEKAGFEILNIKFYGHTLRLKDLAERLGLIWRPLGRVMAGLVKMFRMEGINFHVNPHIKMIVFLRKIREI